LAIKSYKFEILFDEIFEICVGISFFFFPQMKYLLHSRTTPLLAVSNLSLHFEAAKFPPKISPYFLFPHSLPSTLSLHCIIGSCFFLGIACFVPCHNYELWLYGVIPFFELQIFEYNMSARGAN